MTKFFLKTVVTLLVLLPLYAIAQDTRLPDSVITGGARSLQEHANQQCLERSLRNVAVARGDGHGASFLEELRRQSFEKCLGDGSVFVRLENAMAKGSVSNTQYIKCIQQVHSHLKDEVFNEDHATALRVALCALGMPDAVDRR